MHPDICPVHHLVYLRKFIVGVSKKHYIPRDERAKLRQLRLQYLLSSFMKQMSYVLTKLNQSLSSLFYANAREVWLFSKMQQTHIHSHIYSL